MDRQTAQENRSSDQSHEDVGELPNIVNGRFDAYRQSWMQPRKRESRPADQRAQSRVWNRQSIQIFADFNDFTSPRGSKTQRAPEGDETISIASDGNDSDVDSFDEIALEKDLPEAPYHIFTLAQKKRIIYIVSAAAIFSPLSSNIYFPALGAIAADVKVSLSLISLTITVYMVLQGLAPSFWGPLSDTRGRRPVFVGTFVVYLIANIGLAFVRDFDGLMVLRGIQAIGSAATISIGAGVIGDITTAKERGGLIGIFGGLRMMAQAIGPVIGGLLTQAFGFRGIFWFLFILGSLSLALIIVFLPETLRTIAGNGTIRLTGFSRPLIYRFKEQPESLFEPSGEPMAKIRFADIVAPLKFLFEKDVFISLFFGSIIYTVWSCVTSTTAALLQERFHLTNLEIGLAFLPNGAGCVVGSFLTGYMMDLDYKKTEVEYRLAKGLPSDAVLKKKELVDFPIERARLRSTWWIVLLFVITTAIYGFSIDLNILPIPLVLQFFIAYAATAIFSFNSALVIDLFPGASASATAVNNLMRCSVGALGVGVVQLIIDGIGAGFTFLMFALLTLGLSPLLVVEWYFGMGWRGERTVRLAQKKAKVEEEKVKKAAEVKEAKVTKVDVMANKF